MNKNVIKIIGIKFMLLRHALGLSQIVTAETTGISREYVAKIEGRERTNVSRPVLESMCRWLNTTQEWLTEGLGWAYEPPSIYEAMRFVDGCLKLMPEAVTIVTYSDGRKTRGFVFTTPAGTVSMSGSQTQPDCPEGKVTFQEALRMIAKSRIPVGHILLDEKESKGLACADMEMLAKKARYGETDLGKYLTCCSG